MDAMSIYKHLPYAPCLRCTERTAACHCACARYVSYLAAVRKAQSERFGKLNPA